jgi:hypothetical protein
MEAAMSELWQYPIEPEGGWPLGEQRETITVESAPDGWVAISVGPYDGYLPPDKVEEFIAAVRAAAGETT